MWEKDLVEKALVTFADYLKRNNLKMTRERRLILREIFNEESHLEAEELLARFRSRGDKVSRATIYRTFDLLLRAGLIKKSDFGHDHFHYEKKYGREHHDHLVCVSCGEVIEFFSSDLEKLQEKVCKEHDFQMDNHSLQIFGLCRRCRNKN